MKPKPCSSHAVLVLPCNTYMYESFLYDIVYIVYPSMTIYCIAEWVRGCLVSIDEAMRNHRQTNILIDNNHNILPALYNAFHFCTWHSNFKLQLNATMLNFNGIIISNTIPFPGDIPVCLTVLSLFFMYYYFINAHFGVNCSFTQFQLNLWSPILSWSLRPGRGGGGEPYLRPNPNSYIFPIH